MGQMVTIPLRDEAGEEGEEEGSGEERVEVGGEEGEPGPHKIVCKGEAGRAVSRTGREVGGAFSGVRGCFFSLFAFCVFSLARDLGGRGSGVPRLDGRTLHFGSGKCRLRTGVGRKLGAVKSAAAIAHSGWMQLGNKIDFTHRPFSNSE